MAELDTLHTIMQAGICSRCKQWAQSDDVFMMLPRMERVICLRCAEVIMDKPIRLHRKLAEDAIAAAGTD